MFLPLIQGCDASLLVNSTSNNQAEKDALPNLTIRGFSFIDRVKSLVEAECPGIVSCADIIALVARDSIVATVRTQKQFYSSSILPDFFMTNFIISELINHEWSPQLCVLCYSQLTNSTIIKLIAKKKKKLSLANGRAKRGEAYLPKKMSGNHVWVSFLPPYIYQSNHMFI